LTQTAALRFRLTGPVWPVTRKTGQIQILNKNNCSTCLGQLTTWLAGPVWPEPIVKNRISEEFGVFSILN
jgi:hypothetical protein